MRISFIVPVYNVEGYLEKCVNSLLHQHIPVDDFEIILIDDGSKDRSGLICDSLAASNHSIIVIHQSNRGLSEARNVGVKVARGRYIQFVDSDDFLEEDVVLGLLDVMDEKDLDVLRFQARQVFEHKEPSSALFEFSSKETQDVITGARYLQDYMGYACYACQFVFRTSFLIGHSLWFKPGIIFEDTEWTPRVLNLARRVLSINVMVYDYLVREGSITRGPAEKRTDGQLFLVGKMKEQQTQMEEKDWHQGMIAHLVISIITTAATVLYEKRKGILAQLREMDVYPLSDYHLNERGRWKVRLINFSPSIACLLIHWLNK